MNTEYDKQQTLQSGSFVHIFSYSNILIWLSDLGADSECAAIYIFNKQSRSRPIYLIIAPEHSQKRHWSDVFGFQTMNMYLEVQYQVFIFQLL